MGLKWITGNALSLPPRLEDYLWILREIKKRFVDEFLDNE